MQDQGYGKNGLDVKVTELLSVLSVLRAPNGERNVAFRKLHDLLVRYLMGKELSREDAEDIALEVLLRCSNHVEAAGKIKTSDHLRNLFYCIANGLRIDLVRRMRKHLWLSLEELAEQLLPEQLISSPASNPAVLAERRALQEKVREAVHSLPEKQRKAIELIDFEGLSYNEAAQILGLSLKAINGLLHRARQAVRRELERKHPALFGTARGKGAVP
jgi:RNA polymerase sigma-70 factor (ECF subfamily)